jgi:hypothetical protein
MDLIKALEEQEAYRNSPKNKKDCSLYIEDCSRMVSLVDSYNMRYSELMKVQVANTIYKQYASGGEMLHRGYYLPSPTFDLVTGNCNRGRLLKKVTAGSKIAYEYSFDNNNNLIMVKKQPDTSYETIEIILHEGSSSIGITFDKDKMARDITECIYEDGKITSYLYCLYESYGNKVVTYQKEHYQYTDGLLQATERYDFTPGIMLLQHNKYDFKHDEEGNLATYHITEYQGDTIKESYWDGHVFQVLRVRKA